MCCRYGDFCHMDGYPQRRRSRPEHGVGLWSAPVIAVHESRPHTGDERVGVQPIHCECIRDSGRDNGGCMGTTRALGVSPGTALKASQRPRDFHVSQGDSSAAPDGEHGRLPPIRSTTAPLCWTEGAAIQNPSFLRLRQRRAQHHTLPPAPPGARYTVCTWRQPMAWPVAGKRNSNTPPGRCPPW